MKIALVGYGKMGKAIEETALKRGHEIVCIIDVNNLEDFDSDAFRSADVAIEFTIPASAPDNCLRCFAENVPVVIGTTGWLERFSEIKEICEKTGQTFFYASNYSPGVNLFFAMNKYLAQMMNKYPMYNVSMEEMHHIHKLDSPSGTAITLAEDILKNIDRKKSWKESETVSDDELMITTYRKEEEPGYHSIIYDSDVDTIQISHNAKNRKGLALGAVIAAEFIQGKKGFFEMKDIFKF